MGVSPQQYGQYGQLTSDSAFASNQGQKDISASGDFMRAILSGDAAKISQVLAPQVGAAKQSAQQQNKTNTAFNTRSGGTAASNVAANDKVHSDITDLVGKLTGSSASSLASEGSSLLGQGMSGAQTGFDEASKIQQQKEAKFNDIVKSTIAVAAAPFTDGASLTGLQPTSNPFKSSSGGGSSFDPMDFSGGSPTGDSEEFTGAFTGSNGNVADSYFGAPA